MGAPPKTSSKIATGACRSLSNAFRELQPVNTADLLAVMCGPTERYSTRAWKRVAGSFDRSNSSCIVQRSRKRPSLLYATKIKPASRKSGEAWSPRVNLLFLHCESSLCAKGIGSPVQSNHNVIGVSANARVLPRHHVGLWAGADNLARRCAARDQEGHEHPYPCVHQNERGRPSTCSAR